jgi:hypothetical protein
MKVLARHPQKGAVLLGAILAGLLSLSIFQMNALTALVYHMGDQEKRSEQLKESNLLLEAQQLPVLSRVQMEDLAQAREFERVKEVSYLRVLNATVATTKIQE